MHLNESYYPGLRWAFTIPNGTRTSIHVAAKMKAEGVRKGIADIMIPHASGGYMGMFLELKSERGTLSPEQKQFLHDMALEGYYTEAAHGLDEAIELITKYLEMDAK